MTNATKRGWFLEKYTATDDANITENIINQQ